jgi:hypothetical protein
MMAKGKGKGKSIPGQAMRVPGGSRVSRQSTDEGGKVVSPTHRPSLPSLSENIPATQS